MGNFMSLLRRNIKSKNSIADYVTNNDDDGKNVDDDLIDKKKNVDSASINTLFSRDNISAI